MDSEKSKTCANCPAFRDAGEDIYCNAKRERLGASHLHHKYAVPVCDVGRLLLACHYQRNRARFAEASYRHMEKSVYVAMATGIKTILDNCAASFAREIKRGAVEKALAHHNEDIAAELVVVLGNCAEDFEATIRSVAADFIKSVQSGEKEIPQC